MLDSPVTADAANADACARDVATRACGIVLAGGRGTRISHLFPACPKPFIEAQGQPFVEWVIRHAARQGLREFVVSVGHLSDVAYQYFRQRPRDGLRIALAREEAPLGTGGAARFAAAGREQDWLVVMNADSLVVADWRPAFAQLRDDPSCDGVILATHMSDASRYGVMETDGAGRLVSFREKRRTTGLVNAGVYFLRRRLLEHFGDELPLSLETQAIPRLLELGFNLRVQPCDGELLDIGTPQSVILADEFIRAHLQRAA